jgi:hypothetical protein
LLQGCPFELDISIEFTGGTNKTGAEEYIIPIDNKDRQVLRRLLVKPDLLVF